MRGIKMRSVKHIVHNVIRKGFSEEVTDDLRTAGRRKHEFHEAYRKNIPGREHSMEESYERTPVLKKPKEDHESKMKYGTR